MHSLDEAKDIARDILSSKIGVMSNENYIYLKKIKSFR